MGRLPVSSTRAQVSVRSPPLVPRSDTPKAAAWNGGRSIGTIGDLPPENARSYGSSPRPKSASRPSATIAL